jgi:hypothetical protein
MSRVEPKENPEEQRRQSEPRREQKPIGHTPGKAEGEERDVDEALENQEKRSS